MENKEIMEENNDKVGEVTSEEIIREEDVVKNEDENLKDSEKDVKYKEIESNDNELERKDDGDIKEKNEKKKKKKFTRKEIIIIGIASLIVLMGAIIITNSIIGSNKGFKLEKIANKNKNKQEKLTYKEYKKNATEFYYERMLVKMSKDYEPIITMGDEKIFEKKDTKQRMVIYVKENKDSASMGKAYLRKSVKKINKKAEYIETVKYDEFEYDIYEGKDKKDKFVKYVITANKETKILVTYTYDKKGQDSDLKLILQSIKY